MEALLWRAAHRTLTPQSVRESPPALPRRLELRVPRARSEGLKMRTSSAPRWGPRC
jgi:hypothetical protein